MIVESVACRLSAGIGAEAVRPMMGGRKFIAFAAAAFAAAHYEEILIYGSVGREREKEGEAVILTGHP